MFGKLSRHADSSFRDFGEALGQGVAFGGQDGWVDFEGLTKVGRDNRSLALGPLAVVPAANEPVFGNQGGIHVNEPSLQRSNGSRAGDDRLDSCRCGR